MNKRFRNITFDCSLNLLFPRVVGRQLASLMWVLLELQVTKTRGLDWFKVLKCFQFCNDGISWLDQANFKSFYLLKQTFHCDPLNSNSSSKVVNMLKMLQAPRFWINHARRKDEDSAQFCMAMVQMKFPSFWRIRFESFAERIFFARPSSTSFALIAYVTMNYVCKGCQWLRRRLTAGQVALFLLHKVIIVARLSSSSCLIIKTYASVNFSFIRCSSEMSTYSFDDEEEANRGRELFEFDPFLELLTLFFLKDDEHEKGKKSSSCTLAHTHLPPLSLPPSFLFY